MTSDERTRTLEAYDDLLAAVERAIGDGFHHSGDLHEVVYANARALGVTVWPTLARRIAAEARRSTPSPVWTF